MRRLSERGGEGSGPSAREAAFLATLSQTPAPQSGGRRHSVVTISRVPTTLFGRTRRESIAAFPMGGATRILQSRRDSSTGMTGPPSNSGSTHNLQLDIMDDIAEIKARKVDCNGLATFLEIIIVIEYATQCSNIYINNMNKIGRITNQYDDNDEIVISFPCWFNRIKIRPGLITT